MTFLVSLQLLRLHKRAEGDGFVSVCVLLLLTLGPLQSPPGSAYQEPFRHLAQLVVRHYTTQLQQIEAVVTG